MGNHDFYQMNFSKYLLNCFLLLIPILLWNILLIDELPEGYSSNIFWKDIPNIIGYSENFLRVVLFVFPSIMILSLKTRLEKIGLGIYLIGLFIYCLSWILMIMYPESNWSMNLIGFSAPAYTTIIWFIGIGLIGNKSFFKIPYLSFIYIGLSMIFVIFHTAHAYIVFQRF